MKDNLHFDTISQRLVMRADLTDMSTRDMCLLCHTLMDSLGITERFHAEPDETARAQQIIVEQWDKNWGGRS